MKALLTDSDKAIGRLFMLLGTAAVVAILGLLLISGHSTAGAAGPEICDGIDNNGNSQVDELFPDTDNNGIADCVQTDDDSDGSADQADNCPLVANALQTDANSNGIGDSCEGNGPTTTNPSSAGTINIDGQFGPATGEWNDVTPVTFFKTDAKVYAAADAGQDAIYLMYDFGLSTAPLAVGEEVGPISFKLGPGEYFDVFIKQGGPNTNFGPNPGVSQGDIGDTVRVLLNGAPFNDGGCDEGAVDFNTTSPNYAVGHNLAELEVGLHGFGNGCYSPEPAFWSATIPAILPLGDPPVLVSQAFFNIDNNFTTTVFPVVEGPPTDPTCSDGLENDGDTLVDLLDPDCQQPAVGGASALAVDPTTDSGSSVLIYAGIAAAALVLLAGAWYTRRRWLG